MLTAAAAGILPLADIPLDVQRARRQARVEDALRRGRVRADVRPLVSLPDGARARVKLRTGPAGRLGFNRPGTHEWVEVALEGLARPEIVAEAERVAGHVSGEVELRSDGARVAVVVERSCAVQGHVFSVGGALGEDDARRVGRRRGKVLSGDPTLIVDGLRVSPTSFYQVNLEINARIVADVDALLVELAPAHLLDLYAGIGNLSARAVLRGVPTTLVELDASSAADARVNAPGAEVLEADAGRIAAGRHFFDVLLLDPPRAGAPGLLPRLCVTRPRAILYLSCEPANLARDIAPLLGQGYRVERVQPYDMFPGTEHVETLAVLVR